VIAGSLAAILSVARKEFLHIWRDRRVLVLLLALPPIFTLVFGHAFESSDIKHVPAILVDADASPLSNQLVADLAKRETFSWKVQESRSAIDNDLLRLGVKAEFLIPPGWGESVREGKALPLRMRLDAGDANIAPQLVGSMQGALAEFQFRLRQETIAALAEEHPALVSQVPPEAKSQLVASMEPWPLASEMLYNPKDRFIDYVIPGIIGLILQLITVTLMASTIAREREAGTLSQLMVTALRRREIVAGKVLPYFALSLGLILMIVVLAAWHFGVEFRQPAVLAMICIVFLLCSLGMGLVISAISRTQTQAIQFSVFFLLPVFILSGAFAPIDQLPGAIRWISELFPLTHFCRAFRFVNLYDAGPAFYLPSVIALCSGIIITFAAAAFLLRRIEE
jgi:ABC-2 type transport system permease protein